MLFVNSVRCHIMHSSKQVTFTLLLKTNKTGCVYVVCLCGVLLLHCLTVNNPLMQEYETH